MVDSGSDLNIIRKSLADALDLQPLFPAGQASQADGVAPLRTYDIVHEIVEIKDSFGALLTACEPFVTADTGEPMILGLPWLQRQNPDVDWVHLSCAWRNLHPSQAPSRDHEEVTLESLTENLRSLGLHQVMQVRLELLKDSEMEAIPIQIPGAYSDLAEVFSEVEASTLPPHRDEDHVIDLEAGKVPPFGPIYSLSAKELQVLRDYLDENLVNGFIRPSRSSAGAPVLFAPKGDGGLRLCVDYRGLNAITLKNRYPLPLIEEIMDRLSGAVIFTKIDIKNAYYRLRIREGDEWKTAFRTRYGLFEYLVMPFGLTNAPASFQAYIHGVLREHLDVFVIVFLDDILVYSSKMEEHPEHVRKVLRMLLNAGLYAKLGKCQFSVTRVPFLGFVITDQGIEMEEDRIATVLNWPEPESVQEIQAFLGFINFYRRFIQDFSRIAMALTEATKGQNGKTKKELTSRKANFLSPEAKTSFRALVKAFTTAPFLKHFDTTLRIRLETDASGYAISGILSQLHDSGWRVVAYYSRKMIAPERNYETHDTELLAIVESFRHWRHYLEGPAHTVEVLSDHNALRTFMTTHKLTRRQVRWALSLSAFDFRLSYRKGSLNPADGPSRRPDYQREAESEDSVIPESTVLQRVLYPSVALISVEGEGDQTLAEEPSHREILAIGTAGRELTNQRRAAREAVVDESTYENIGQTLIEALPEYLRVDPLAKKVFKGLATREPLSKDVDALPGWTQQGELLYFVTALYIPHVETLRMSILRKHHDDPLAGHLATERTYKLLRAKYYWPDMKSQVDDYCKSCLVCQGARVIRGKPQGTLHPIPVPAKPWEVLTMDFITGLPDSRAYGGTYNSILVIVDKFSKMAHYIPCVDTMTAGELAEVFIKEIIRYHGIPLAIISDRGALFTSRLWANLMYAFRIERKLSTAFHPQTDGQTERQNSVLEQYLRSYINWEQDDWASLLPLAEFAYNSAEQASTKKAPFEVVYGSLPRSDMVTAEEALKYTAAKGTSLEAEELTERLRNTRAEVCQALAKAQEYQKRHYDLSHRDIEFAVGQKVWLHVKNITVQRPSRKLDWQRYGPFRIIERIGKAAYRLKLPTELKIHNVFHVSLLRLHKPRQGDESPEPQPLRIAVDPDKREWEVEAILASRVLANDHEEPILQYKVSWKGFTDLTWEPAEHVKHSRRLVNQFHKHNPEMPRTVTHEGTRTRKGRGRPLKSS